MNQGELLRARRCRLLLIAMLFGIALPILQPSWVTLAVAVIGEALLVFAWRRRCRGLDWTGAGGRRSDGAGESSSSPSSR